jgi:hypothetical protein
MIVRYTRDLFIGALVARRILFCALAVGAIALTLALFPRQDLRRSDAAPSSPVAAQPHVAMATPTREAPPVPAAPAAAAMNPPPAIAPPPEPEQERGMLARRDRATERGSRSR